MDAPIGARCQVPFFSELVETCFPLFDCSPPTRRRSDLFLHAIFARDPHPLARLRILAKLGGATTIPEKPEPARCFRPCEGKRPGSERRDSKRTTLFTFHPHPPECAQVSDSLRRSHFFLRKPIAVSLTKFPLLALPNSPCSRCQSGVPLRGPDGTFGSVGASRAPYWGSKSSSGLSALCSRRKGACVGFWSRYPVGQMALGSASFRALARG